MVEKADFYVVYHYIRSDGENIFGPDVYLIKAENREEIVKKINDLFPGQALSIKFKPIILRNNPQYIGTLVRDELLN